jgi:hypothetical protein
MWLTLNYRYIVVTTRAYTKAEEARAEEAYDLICNCGYPLYAEAVHLIQDGNFINMPMLTAEDIKRAYNLYGEPVGSVRGKMIKRQASRARFDDHLIMDQKKQTLQSEVMNLDGQLLLLPYMNHHNLLYGVP